MFRCAALLMLPKKPNYFRAGGGESETQLVSRGKKFPTNVQSGAFGFNKVLQEL